MEWQGSLQGKPAPSTEVTVRCTQGRRSDDRGPWPSIIRPTGLPWTADRVEKLQRVGSSLNGPGWEVRDATAYSP